jgi:hypothetical protein
MPYTFADVYTIDIFDCILDITCAHTSGIHGYYRMFYLGRHALVLWHNDVNRKKKCSILGNNIAVILIKKYVYYFMDISEHIDPLEVI